MSESVVKMCERCDCGPAIPRERYCKDCRKIVLKELEDAGHLTPYVGTGHGFRSADQMENTYETKHGTGH